MKPGITPRQSVTSALANAVRGMPDRWLAQMARELDDRSLVTLANACASLDQDAHRLLPDPAHSADPNRSVAKNKHCAPNGTTDRVYAAVVEHPGLGARALATKVATTPTGLRKALVRLRNEGLIRREGCTSDSRYFPTLKLADTGTSR